MLLCSHCCGIGPHWQIEGSNDSETFMTSVSSGAGDVSPFFSWILTKSTEEIEEV